MDNFGEELEISENHRILASLPIETYWTTNYDHLIEKSPKIRQRGIEKRDMSL
ncbi:hypothetical protein EfmAA242_06420 [Enterococcus faecium]|nr:hypothetical protein EfmAA242_06420 [Enterococcus faecium]